MDFRLRPAKTSDAPLLARMNAQLIEDEGSDNYRSVEQLEQRMREWLDGAYSALIVEVGDEPGGYMLYRIDPGSYDPYQQDVYVRQFFIARDRRGEGLGERAFESAVEDYFPSDCRIVLEALQTNPGGHRFWNRLGFTQYYTGYFRNEKERNGSQGGSAG